MKADMRPPLRWEQMHRQQVSHCLMLNRTIQIQKTLDVGHRQQLSGSSNGQASQRLRSQAPSPPHRVTPAERASPADVATPAPGPEIPCRPSAPRRRFQPYYRSGSVTSNLSIQSVDVVEGTPEPATALALERAVKGMDNLLGNHEYHYRKIMSRRAIARQLRLKARTARSLIAQEVGTHERLSRTLSYFRRAGQEWSERDVYGSMCRARRLWDGTYEEITSEDEREEAQVKE